MSLMSPSRVCVTLDLILKTLIASPDFQSLSSKNWEAISRLIPGTTANQCCRRYEELVNCSDIPSHSQQASKVTGTPGNTNATSQEGSFTINNENSSEALKYKDAKDVKRESSVGGRGGSGDAAEHSPMMVIHVCDESKGCKKDFHCPRDLLVMEMKYFAEYLSTDTQRCEEVDISVHCDVNIFDWLIKYVKRGTKEHTDTPKLEASNVVSILISSDFLKMDSLVEECVEYCHRHMSTIVSTNCNMNCINDKLVTRITDLFTNDEADDIKDRKDKFKSKLFSKKLEKLFSPDYSSFDSPENASTLYRCSVCHRLLTARLEKVVRCMPSRMTVGAGGKLSFAHVKDSTFDVNAHLTDLKAQLKTWRDVYWRVWGTVNVLTCSRCGDAFPLTEFGHCRYHPEAPRYDNADPGSLMSCVGMFPCCQLRTVRFDPLVQNKGCRVKDHIIALSHIPDDDNEERSQTPQHHLYDCLLARRDVICVPFQHISDFRDMEADVFGNEVYANPAYSSVSTVPSLSQAGNEREELQRPQPSLQNLTVEREVSNDDDEFGASDDELGDEETQSNSTGKKLRGSKKSRVTVKQQAILVHAPGFEQTKKSVWDAGRTMRYNQDAQRQEDQRRVKEIRMYLTKLRLTPEKVERPKKEFAGGIFSRLEAQWRASQAPSISKPSGPAPFRAKPKPPMSVRSNMA